MLELLVSVIVAVVLDVITEVVEVEAARLVVLKVEVGVMVVDKTEGKVEISGKDGPRITSVVHDCRIGAACGKAVYTGEENLSTKHWNSNH